MGVGGGNQGKAARAALAHLRLAPFDPTQWPLALKSMSAATNGSFGQFFAWDGDGRIADNCYSEPLDDTEWLAAGGADPRNNPYMRAATRLTSGQGFTDWEIVSPQERRKHPIIGDIHDRYDVPHLCTYQVLKTRDTRLFMVSLRSSRQGPIDRAERELFLRICRGGALAAKRAAALENHGAKLLASGLNAMSLIAFVWDDLGRVIAMSESAEALVRSGSVLQLRGPLLRARNSESARALEHALLVAARRRSEPASNAELPVHLRDGAGQVVATAHAIPLPRDRCNIGLGAAGLLVIKNSTAPDCRPALQRRFGLTRAEAEVGRLLLQRLGTEEIAVQRGVSRETVRSQTKAVYAKVGVSGQRALVAKWGHGR